MRALVTARIGDEDPSTVPRSWLGGGCFSSLPRQCGNGWFFRGANAAPARLCWPNWHGSQLEHLFSSVSADHSIWACP